jgi:glycosyltransferase involved in cell wall biosynthesis
VGGPGKTILETFRAIDARRFAMHLGVFAAGTESAETPFVRAARNYGMRVHVIRGFNQFDPTMIAGVIGLARRLAIDVIHAHEVKSDVIAWLAARFFDVRTVTTVHGWICNSRRQRLYAALDKRVLRGFDKVIAVSAPIRDELEKAGVRNGSLHLLHNAIVANRYQRLGRRGFLATLLEREHDGPVLAAIGRISPEKGQRQLVEALGILQQLDLRPITILAGDGPDREPVRHRICELGLSDRVFLPGYLPEPQLLLEETDLLVLPSHSEGLPNVALEALAMEVPVLATRVGGTPEIISDGETGRLVEPGSPEALASAIAEFLRDQRSWKEMAVRGRQVVESEFSFDARTRKLEAIYNAVSSGWPS